MQLVCSLTHWGSEMKKAFNLKCGTGGKEMNKRTYLYVVAQ